MTLNDKLTIASGISLTIGNELVGVENLIFTDRDSGVMMFSKGTIKNSQNVVVASIDDIDSSARGTYLSLTNWNTNDNKIAIAGHNISFTVTDSEIFNYVDLSCNGTLVYNDKVIASTANPNALFGMTGGDSFVRVMKNSDVYSYNLGSGVVIQNDLEFNSIGIMQGDGSVITIGTSFNSNNEKFKDYFFDKDGTTGIIPQANQTFKAINNNWILQ